MSGTHVSRRKILLPLAGVIVLLAAGLGVLRFAGSDGGQERDAGQTDGALAYMGVDDLFQEATLIVEGTVSGAPDEFQIMSVSGSVANFSDYPFRITSVFRGTPDNSAENITIRIQGGTVNNLTEEYSGSPKFEVGQDYLVFLYQPERGGSFNTEGDYYYVLGLSQGVFAKDGDGQYASQVGEVLDGNDLAQPLNDTPVDPEFFRNEYIENQKRNLENGMISQEEFDRLMENIDEYATIMK